MKSFAPLSLLASLAFTHKIVDAEAPKKQATFTSTNGVLNDFSAGKFHEEKLNVEFASKMQVMTQPWSLPVSMSLVGASARCMHEMCWLPMARAYSLAMYADEKQVNSLRTAVSKGLMDGDGTVLFDREVDKVFVFHFVGQKDKAHIIRGFDRALSGALPRAETMFYNMTAANEQLKEFVTFLKMVDMTPNSKLYIALCNQPQPYSLVFYSENDDSPARLIGSVKGTGLPVALHALYLEKNEFGKIKYPELTKDLTAGAAKLLQ